jgi:hypothetical protein
MGLERIAAETRNLEMFREASGRIGACEDNHGAV